MRSRIVRVRTSDTEFSRMKDIATGRGPSISVLIRRAALGVRMPARTFDANHAATLAPDSYTHPTLPTTLRVDVLPTTEPSE